ncbi:hypothetical protein Glove_140g151 [Diversispora epigaea]|uniref:CST complex subunit STN1 n=1 Tax=Diversispora epigaea TaxID=1348612 RepID=A0A397IZP5_9GLOM|nr:hypothetical protein Glove_140g151 [Diversispora epigaea]
MSSKSSLHSDSNTYYFYPPALWKLDPTYNANVKLFFKDYANLKVVEIGGRRGIFYLNHIINRVDVIGVVSSIHDIIKYDNKVFCIKYYLDDGSATIPCIVFFETLKIHDEWIKQHQIEHGNLVRIIGNINEYRGKIQVKYKPEDLWKVDDPNMELLRWAEIMTLVQDVYSKPFVVPEDEWNKYVDKERKPTSNNTFTKSTSNYGSSTEFDKSPRPLTSASTSTANATSSSSSSSSSSENIIITITSSIDLNGNPFSNDKKRKRVNDDDENDENIRPGKKIKDFQPIPKTFYRRKKRKNINLKASQITKDVLIDSIVNYIYDNNLTSFRLSWIRQEPIFVTYCEYILRHQYYEDPTDDLITVLLKRSLSELVNENFLTFADKKNLLYEVKGEYVDYNN